MFSNVTKFERRVEKRKEKERRWERLSTTRTRKSERIFLNISGETYETRITTLERFPDTLLGDRNRRLLYYCEKSKQYHFRRSKLFFDAILFFYQSNGILRCPHELPVELFEAECRFFQMPQNAIEGLRYQHSDELNFAKNEQIKSTKNRFWDILNNPNSSKYAKAYSFFSVSIIGISVLLSCLETLPSFKVDTKIFKKNPWLITDICFNSWFLIELTIYMVFTPKRKAYLKRPMTWIDIIAVGPYWVGLIIAQADITSYGFKIIRIVRLLRTLRLLRLSKHCKMLRIVGYIIRSSAEEFKTLLFCLIICLVFGGSIMYFLEHNITNTHFHDITSGVYWSMQTISTLGYGDIYPQTGYGKLFASGFAVFGVVSIAVPVISIIAKFAPIHQSEIITVRRMSYDENDVP